MSDSEDSGQYSSNDEAESGFYIQKEQSRFRQNHWDDPEDDDYEERAPKRAKGSRNVRFANGAGGPGFVPSTSTITESTSPVQEEEDDNAKKFHSLLHVPAESKRNEDFKKMLAAREPPVISKEANPEALQKVGTWEKHTKGFGKKMLEKFGFKGRLGAKEQGVSASIEVKVRPGTIGLGFGDFAESSSLESNKKLAAEVQGKDYVPKEEPKKRMPVTEARAQSKSWKLGGVTITEASEAKSSWKVPQNRKTESTAASAAPKQVIVDMRGPTQRIISDVASTGLSYFDEKPDDVATKLLGQELLYNLNLVVDMDEMELHSKNRKLNTLHDTIKSYEIDRNTLEQEHESALAAHRRTQRIDTTLSDFTDQLAARTLSRQHVEASLLHLQETCEEDMTLLGVAQCIPSIARVIIQQQIDIWDVADDPTFPLVVFTDWLGTISTVTPDTMHESLQDAMVACIDKVQRYIMNTWDVYDPSIAVVAVASVKEVVSGPIYKEFVELILMPKIARAVAAWNPKRDSVPIHSWLLPWVPVLRSQLAALYPDIRRKLASALSAWNPLDSSVYYMIEPFVAVFDSTSMEAFLGRAILPKLVIALRQQAMEPGQSTAAIEAVLRWCDIIPEMHLVAMIEGEFFPRWFRVLCAWLSQRHVNFAEVALWYQFWRKLFPDELVKHPRITLHFSYAIEAMSFALSRISKKQDLSAADIMSRIPLPLHKDYFAIIQERKLQQAAEKQLLESHHMKKDEMGGFSTSAPTEVSFRDVVEEFAIENNVEFVPKINQTHDGKPLWMFGNVTCYIDQHVVFAQIKENERYIWKPIALESLLALTR